MTITYPLDFPTITGINQIVIEPGTVVSGIPSNFTGQMQVQKYPGQWWGATITLPPLIQSKAAVWEAFLLSLNGKEGTFLMSDPRFTAPLGTAATTPGTPKVNGASQTGKYLAIDGLPLSTTGYLLAGSRIQLGTGSGTRLHAVLEDVDTDAGGNGTLSLWPEIRNGEAPADNDDIILTSPKGHFRLMQNRNPFSAQAMVTNISFSCMEVL